MAAEHGEIGSPTERGTTTRLCPEAEYRDSLSDAEFWEHVFRQPEEWDDSPSLIDEEDVIAMSHLATPCPECGQTRACAYDSEGRALIHVTQEDDDA